MITTAVESLREGLEEIKVLLPVHYRELALNKDKVPLQPQYSMYLRLEDEGSLLYVTLREEGRLVGYFLGFIRRHLHYETMTVCTMDIFYVDPEKRAANPRAGVKLFRAVEKEAARRGVHNLVVGSKLHKDASVLFKYLGYNPIETYYAKWIGD
jgi:GNAT superfamily N-acetyltransferase